MKADLHVHSWFSKDNGNLPFLRSRDCYSSPDAVYRTARARGMDLVTITDHDTLDGCLDFLDRHPDAADFIPAEEVSCRFPDGDIEVHLGVYGMTEALHRDLQPLRGNVFEVTARLRAAGVFFSLNHLLHFYRRQAPLDAYLRLLAEVPALEARNGAMSPAHNTLVEQCARAASPALAAIGGSDAHTLRRIGRTWTEVPGARDAAAFMQGLRDGACRPGGDHGDTWALAGDVYGVVFKYIASLAGAGPRDHRAIERLACGAFSVVSAPFQFIPLLIAAMTKARERRIVAYATRALAPRLAPQALVADPVAD
jgi:predicted metal-dependent phosphoesterase TrpH